MGPSLKDLAAPTLPTDAPLLRKPRKSRRVANPKKAGRRPGRKNLATIEKEMRAEIEAEVRSGRKLAKDRLEEIMNFFFALMGRHQPRYDEHGVLIGGSLEETYRAAEVAIKCAIPLAQYQSPKIGSLIPQQAPNVEGDHVTMTVNIFDSEGGMVRSVTTSPKQIEGTVDADQ